MTALPRRAVVALLIALPIIVYARSLRFPLLDFDDPVYVTESPIVRAPGLTGLALAWSRPYFHDYIPLTHTTLWIDARAGGLRPTPFRIQSLIWHIAAGLLVFFAARFWTASEIRAQLAALLFAVHPLAVESVAWVSARKNVVSLVLFLSAYLAWAGGERRGHPVAGRLSAGVLFVASLLAKSASVGLPLVTFADSLLIQARKISRSLFDSLPYIAIAGVYLFFAYGLRHDLPDEPLLAGPAGFIALDIQVLARYVLNMILPVKLSAFYAIDLAGFRGAATWLSAASLLSLLAVPFLWIKERRRAAFLLAWALAGLLPALNLVPQPHPIADRFFYWSLPALLAFFVVAAGDGLMVLRQSAAGTARGGLIGRAVPVLAAGAVAALAIGTFSRVAVWRSTRALFEDAVRKSPDSSVAHMHLGNLLSNRPSAELKARAVGEFRTMLSCADAERSLKQTAKDGATLFIAQMEFEEGRKVEADARVASHFAGRESRPEVALLLAQYDLSTGRPESVIRRLEPSLLDVPGISELGRSLLLAPELPYRYNVSASPQARDVYLAAQQRQGLLRALSLLGKAYLEAGRSLDAAATLSIVASLSRPDESLIRDLGRAYHAAGYPERAQACSHDAEILAEGGTIAR